MKTAISMEFNSYFNTSFLTLITDLVTAACYKKMLVFFSLSEDQICNNWIRTLRFDKTVLKNHQNVSQKPRFTKSGFIRIVMAQMFAGTGIFNEWQKHSSTL